jgi:error-prone DNA polymerase
MSYIELHARSAFSFLEGSSLPEEFAAVCAQLKMPAMALLDTDGVYGAPRFHLAAKKIGLKAHIGAEVTCDPLPTVMLSGDGAARSAGPSESKNSYTRQTVQAMEIPRFARNDKASDNKPARDNNPFRLPLLVSSRAGYQNLCRLITKMKLRAKKGEGAVHKEEIEEHAHGLICLTGGA